jgi:hypothetical protein
VTLSGPCPSLNASLDKANHQPAVNSAPPISPPSRHIRAQAVRPPSPRWWASVPAMANGAKHRNAQSAADGNGGGWRTTSSYQPHTALPKPATSADPPNSSQDSRTRPRNCRALRRLDAAASTAAADNPRSPITSATV